MHNFRKYGVEDELEPKPLVLAAAVALNRNKQRKKSNR
jgi:hypothetical protein